MKDMNRIYTPPKRQSDPFFVMGFAAVALGGAVVAGTIVWLIMHFQHGG